MNSIAVIDVDYHEPRWLNELRSQCASLGRQKVSDITGYSRATLSQVLNNKYKGNLKEVEKAVRGAFLGETVMCPVLGELETNKCMSYQKEKRSAVNPLRVQLYRNCNGNCPNSGKNQEK